MSAPFEPTVAVREERSGQIWPKRVPWDPFQAKFGGILRFGPHPAPCGQVLGGFDTLRGYFELFLLYLGDPLEPVRGLWGR